MCLAVSAFVAQSKGKKGSSSLGTGKQTLRISGKGQGKVEEVGMASSLKCTVPQNFNLRPMR